MAAVIEKILSCPRPSAKIDIGVLPATAERAVLLVYALAVMGLADCSPGGTTTLVLACLEMKGATRHAVPHRVLPLHCLCNGIRLRVPCLRVGAPPARLAQGDALSLRSQLTTLLCGLLIALLVEAATPSRRKRLEEWLHIFGKFHSIEEVGKKLVVHFARHADAEQVVKHPRISATLLYDERHYMARPRCILEQGMAMLAASHCYHVFKYSHPSARLLQAEATRPKLVKLKDGNATAATCKERPQAILTRTTASLMGASFVDKLERERLTALLASSSSKTAPWTRRSSSCNWTASP